MDRGTSPTCIMVSNFHVGSVQLELLSLLLQRVKRDKKTLLGYF